MNKFDICDNCQESEPINEECDLYCKAKDKVIKRTKYLRHCDEYKPIKRRVDIMI